MTLSACERSCDSMAQFIPATLPDRSTTVRLMEFVLGTVHFAVDLQEIREIVCLADLARREDAPWVVPGIIRRNRWGTLVFDLEQCIRFQWGIAAGSGKTGFMELDKEHTGVRIGVLLPGISRVMTIKTARSRACARPEQENPAPIHGIIRMSGKRALHANVHTPVIWIDCWRLIENCVLAGCTETEKEVWGGLDAPVNPNPVLQSRYVPPGPEDSIKHRGPKNGKTSSADNPGTGAGPSGALHANYRVGPEEYFRKARMKAGQGRHAWREKPGCDANG